MTMKKLLGVAAVMVLGGSGVASAQVYGPGPGILTKHLWTIPGVINNGMATAISCTNATANTVTVGVEFFWRRGWGGAQQRPFDRDGAWAGRVGDVLEPGFGRILQ